MKNVDDLDAIFKAEEKLTNIRHEIETLTGTLNKLNDLVDLSTITINMQETLSSSKDLENREESSYLSKLKETFLDSFKNVLDFCSVFIMGVVSALPALFLLGIILVIIVLIYKRFIKKIFKKFNNENFNPENKTFNSNDKDLDVK